MNYKIWLKNFQKENKNRDFFIVYQYVDTIHIYKTRYKKDGNFAKGSKLNIDNLFEFRYKNLLDQDDIEIIKILSSFKKIEGDIGALLIRKLLKTGRFLNKNWQPFDFKKSEFYLSFDDGIKLHYEKVDTIFRTYPIMAKDEKTFFEFDTNITYEEFLTLKKAPNFDKFELFEVYRYFRDKIKSIPPKNYQITTINTTPQAQITLQANRYIQLSFLYDKYELKYNKNSIKYTSNGEVKIIRDEEFEIQKAKELESFGFKNLDGTFIALGDTTQSKLNIWKNLLENIDNIDFIVKYDNFDMNFIDKGDIVANSQNTNGWFSLSFDIKIDKQKYPLIPIIAPILEEINSYEELTQNITLEYEKNRFITFDTTIIKPIIKTLFELKERLQNNKIKIKPYEAHLIDCEKIRWNNNSLLKLSKQLKNFNLIKKIPPPKGLNVTLRDYQQSGLDWLMFLREFQCGGILADDMGLGKTIQTISLLLKLKEQNKLKSPSLIIVPTSLIGNWKVELDKFAPKLEYITLYGNDRGCKFSKIDKTDIVFTTYNLVVRDFDILSKKNFEYIILDEAQKIKNPSSKATQIIKKLNSNYKLALSGTPIENHLGELWSIFSFVMPGFLGSLKEFKKLYQNPIEKDKDSLKKLALQKRIKPFILRRTKEKVAKELPQKIEIIKYAEFNTDELALYKSIRVMMDKKIQEAILKNGINKSQIVILDALLKLRQVCCHPKLLKIEQANKIKHHSKFELFLELVEELLAEKRKILVFSQFTSMIDIIQQKFNQLGINYSTLTGNTKNRDKVINDFKNGKSDIFLISLKAGGVGLNLTEADSVIHYDPWWNPAAQNQATDRAYRIGQDKNVFVYKLVVKNSIEENILELQNNKKSLTQIYDNEKIDTNDLINLLKGEI
jgi:SNF2 family DNA or RNA helicase